MLNLQLLHLFIEPLSVYIITVKYLKHGTFFMPMAGVKPGAPECAVHHFTICVISP